MSGLNSLFGLEALENYKPYDDDNRHKAALEEAGHGVMAVLRQGRIERLTIDTAQLTAGRGGAAHVYTPKDDDKSWLLVGAAGPATQRIFSSGDFHPMSQDEAELMHRVAQTYRDQGRTDDKIEYDADQYVDKELIPEAVDILSAPGPREAIETCAKRLLDELTIEGADAEALIRQCLDKHTAGDPTEA